MGGKVRSQSLTQQRGVWDSFLDEVPPTSLVCQELQIARENTTTKQKAPSKFLISPW